VVLANPPFGKDIKVVGEEKLSQFQLAYKWSENKQTGLYERTDKLQDGSAPQILFVERCLQLLKSGGRLGIVLPESFFHAPDYRFVLQLLQKHNITWVVDLPHNTFRPHNNAKCVMLVVEKDRPQGEIIRMAVAEQMGHDHRGERMGRWDLAKNAVNDKQLWDDLPLIAAESRGAQPPHYTFDVPSATAATKKVYVPRYYWRATDKAVEEMALREGLDLVPFGDLVDRGIITWFDGHGSPPAEAKARGTYPYVRVKDILNWEVFHNPTSMIPKEFYDELRKNQAKDLKTGDVLYVKRGSYRIGSVAIASPHDLEVALTREILVFRAAEENDLGIDGYYLLYMLSSEVARLQTPGKVLMDTTMPNIANRWRDLRLPLHRDPQRRKAVAQQIKAAIEDKWSAEDTILKLRETLTGVADETADTEADEAA
jgi:type I restriction enzyme M protein